MTRSGLPRGPAAAVAARPGASKRAGLVGAGFCVTTGDHQADRAASGRCRLLLAAERDRSPATAIWLPLQWLSRTWNWAWERRLWALAWSSVTRSTPRMHVAAPREGRPHAVDGSYISPWVRAVLPANGTMVAGASTRSYPSEATAR